MNYSNEINIWFMHILFILGLMLIPIGIGFMFIPDKVFAIAKRLNRWIATDVFFNRINAPIYKEKFFYRNHKPLGVIIIMAALTCIYLLTFYSGIAEIIGVLNTLAESEFEEWLFVISYYLLVAALFIAVFFGFIMFIRPSALKSFESWGNHWIDTEKKLEVLNNKKDLPDTVLSGKPRIFGFFIFVSAVYIIYSVA